MKYSPGDILQGWCGKWTVVGYVRYGGCWYYVLMDNKEELNDYSQGEVECTKYFTKIGEAA